MRTVTLLLLSFVFFSNVAQAMMSVQPGIYTVNAMVIQGQSGAVYAVFNPRAKASLRLKLVTEEGANPPGLKSGVRQLKFRVGPKAILASEAQAVLLDSKPVPENESWSVFVGNGFKR